jgi:hypothetical protein
VKNIKTVIVAATLALTMSLQSVAHAATVPDEQLVVKNPLTDDRYTGINLADENFSVNSLSMLEAFTGTGTTRDSKVLTKVQCTSIGEPGCEKDKFFQYNALLGMCDSVLTTDCVVNVQAKDSAGKRYTGKFVENFPGKTAYTYSGDAKIGLPTGSSSFIVEFADLPHAGGNQYLVVVFLHGKRGFGEATFTLEEFKAAIYAVSQVPGSFSMPGPEMDIRPDHILGGRATRAGGFNQNQLLERRSACVKTSSQACALPWPLNLENTFELTMKLSQPVSGWLHGRMFDAESAITKAADGDQLLSIKGRPVVVPGIQAWFKKESYPTPLQKLYGLMSQTQVDAGGLGWPSISGINNGPDGLPYSILKENFGYDDGGFREVSAWIDAVGDKATFAPTVWAFRSIQSQQFSSCMKGTDSLSGIVTTNATMYIGNPPTFNQADQTLDYKVMAPHYLPDGSEFKGSYDLLIKSDVARCIYKFSSAPISASVSIISSDGTAQVATTVVGERDGWLTLSAKGFTFSAPTLRVKLSQKADPAPAKVDPAPVKADPAPVAAPKPAAKKSTISCVKGKTVKKVTAVKPTCPTGYKKR